MISILDLHIIIFLVPIIYFYEAKIVILERCTIHELQKKNVKSY